MEAVNRMHPLRQPFLGLFIALSGGLLCAAPAHSQTFSSGETTLTFEASVLADLGIELIDVSSTAPASRPEGLGFTLSAGESQVGFVAPPGDFEGFSAADVWHSGGLTLVVGGQSIVFDGIHLGPGSDPLRLTLSDASGQAWIDVVRPHPHMAADGNLLEIEHADLLATAELAALLGRPDLTGSYLGVMDAAWHFVPLPPGPVTQGPGDCIPDLEDPVDVELTVLESTSQVAREAGVRVAITFAAELTNNGPGDVAWNYPIAPQSPVGSHPFLALHMYRLANGVLEQIGRADVKHAFFATNTGCACPGDNVLYSGCEDQYSGNTNINQYYLGPRDEVDAFERSWTSLGSHFDEPTINDVRGHGGSSAHDSFEHRLVVQESDLQTSGASYFSEAWYLSVNDTNLGNSLGHREVTPTFSGSSWSFPNADVMELGSILDVWVDPVSPGPGEKSSLVDTGQGRVQLALVTSDLGGGVYHYEYALMNFDYEAQLSSFSVPLAPGMIATNAAFGDADGDSGNDWTASVESDRVVWTAPAGNSLDWGRLYNFRVDVDSAPLESEARMEPLAAGAEVSVPTLAPALFAPAIPALPWPLLAPALLAAGLLAMRRSSTRR